MRQLISSMYDTNSQVDWSNVTPLLELARKYDVEDISVSCGRFLDAETMSACSLSCFTKLARIFSMPALLQRCRDFVAANKHYTAIESNHLLHVVLRP